MINKKQFKICYTGFNYLRIAITFVRKNGKPLMLPIHYNEKIQGMIYRNLSKSLSDWLHTTGYEKGKRKFKLFTFSRLQGNYKARNGEITFKGPVKLWVGSPNTEILESFATHLVHETEIRLGRNPCELISVEVFMNHAVKSPVRVKTLSPITVYSTLYTPERKRKTYYYSPQESEFSALIIKNITKKLQAFHSENAEIPKPDNASIKPIHVKNRHLSIINYKGFIIKGWMGIYELHLPKPYLSMALDAGLGAKNSQGFGMVEVIETMRPNSTGK